MELILGVVQQPQFMDQIVLWGSDIAHWMFGSAISPLFKVLGGAIGGVIASGAILGLPLLYRILNDEI